jgi:hypothetical protein
MLSFPHSCRGIRIRWRCWTWRQTRWVSSGYCEWRLLELISLCSSPHVVFADVYCTWVRSARLTAPSAAAVSFDYIERFCAAFDPTQARLAPERGMCVRSFTSVFPTPVQMLTISDQSPCWREASLVLLTACASPRWLYSLYTTCLSAMRQTSPISLPYTPPSCMYVVSRVGFCNRLQYYTYSSSHPLE